MNDVTINKLGGGLGRRLPNQDMYSGLLANGVAVSGTGKAELGKIYRLKSTADAAAIGIDADYDHDNTVLVYEHISEFFRVNPNGDLFLMLVGKDVTYAEMLNKDEAYAKKLLLESEGYIRQLGVAFNPTTPVADFTATAAAITNAQALAVDEYTRHRPVLIVLEGKGFDPDAVSLTDFRAMNSEYVAVMCGQALPVTELDAAFLCYAAVGTMLGAVSKAAVNEKISWVEKFNMYGGNLTAAGIGGAALTELTEGQLESLEGKGAIFFRTHTGKAGIYFNNSHACTESVSDYAYLENTRTINKAVRLIREIMLPRLDSPVLIDEATGKLSPEVVKSWESDGRRALEEMLRKDEISSLDVFIDPDQNILATSELEISFWIVPTGSASKITVSIGFTNPF
ncbi:MAG: DUF2586 family protein [Bacteroidetes bacterium]|nr:DUF2586 family protein [Bacteroidota bacterium]